MLVCVREEREREFEQWKDDKGTEYIKREVEYVSGGLQRR